MDGQRLDTFSRTIPDYACYLAHILCFLSSQGAHIRSIAGLLLKNNVRELPLRIRSDGSTAVVAAAVLAYVKEAVISSDCLADENPPVRQSASSLISTIMLIFGVDTWPEAIQKILSLVDSGPANPNATYGGFLALSKICEDVPRALEAMSINGTRVVDVLIPRVISHLSASSDSRIRIAALKSLNPFIPSAGANQAEPAAGAMKPYLNDFVQALFRSASDQKPEVRKNVCMALVALLGSVPDVLMPNLGSTVDFMLYSTQDEDEEVALEACEFWLAFAEDSRLRDQLAPYLPKVLPVLLKGMVYSEDELLTLDNDAEDEAVPDREQDIKPRFYGRAEHTGGVHDAANGQAGAGGVKTNGSGASGSGGGGLDEEDDEEEEDDEDTTDDGAGYDEWNLRKCSAAALDVIAVSYGDGLLAIFLPYLKSFLDEPLWTHKEAGILALGAVADGESPSDEPGRG